MLSSTTDGVPSGAIAKTCAQPSRSFSGGFACHRPAGRQRVERAQHALVRHQDRRARRASASSGRSRACTSRGLSPPGGRKSSPRASFSAIAVAELGASVAQALALPFAPRHLDQARLGLRIEAEQRRRFASRAAAGSRGIRARCHSAGRRIAAICSRPRLGQRPVGAALDQPGLVPVGRAVADDEDRGHRRARQSAELRVEERRRRRRYRARARRARIAARAHRQRAVRDRRAARRPLPRRRAASPSGASSPVSPSATTLATPPLRPATTGKPGRLRLEQRHAERLLDRRPDIEVGGAIELLQLLRREHARPSARVRRSGANASRTLSSAGPAPAMTSRHGDRVKRDIASARHAIGEKLLVVAHHGDGQEPRLVRHRARASRRSPRGSRSRFGARNGAVSRNGGSGDHPLGASRSGSTHSASAGFG